ncbi:MAG: alpha/beta hydrolase [Bosea sp.]|uniref:alpha/beta fold hydrolase n=1 Tax=Bosea sp. (in: a-proteobacteria) TaxID=1871050 RepID=UPI0010FA115D|nr:alpha/beta hydrolase [Bosea sp. (in: a-proteobacteria)]MCP4734834.1 alpha/beta hydrolase [Bosea sp. (in: a-proteobacteria)]
MNAESFAEGMTHHLLNQGDVKIAVADQGVGRAIVLLPSLGRGAQDFAEFAGLLVARGFRVVLPQPRGIAPSEGPLANLTMADLAGDVALVIEQLDLAPAVVAGHAFGNFVARMLATIRPELVAGVAMLAGSAGMLPSGESPYDPAVLGALARCADSTLDEDSRIAALKTAFFAPESDCRIWLDGWYPDVKAAQRAADQATAVSTYFAAGSAPILEVQADRDTIAAPRFAHILKEQLGDRVTTVVIHGAGHALIPERPAETAALLAGWAARLDDGPGSISR